MTAAEHGLHSTHYPWAHEGMLETFDHAAIRRGYQVYREVCSACHSLDRIAWRNLVGVSHTVDESKAMAEEVEYEDGPNDVGDMFQRPGKLADYMPRFAGVSWRDLIRAGPTPTTRLPARATPARCRPTSVSSSRPVTPALCVFVLSAERADVPQDYICGLPRRRIISSAQSLCSPATGMPRLASTCRVRSPRCRLADGSQRT